MKNIKNICRKKVLILDGATGTELQRRGMPQGVCPEIWCLDNPKVLKDIYLEYLNAGSDMVSTCTFGANAVKLSEYGEFDVKKINQRLTALARSAVGENCLIAGDIGPLGKFIEPFGPLAFEDAVDIFKEQVKGLIQGGADYLAIETMMDIQEARAALIAVKETTDKFVSVSMTYELNGRTLNGTEPLTALIILQSLGADAVGCNCSAGPQDMIQFILQMKPYAKVPLIAKPNAGIPELIKGKTNFRMGAKEFAFYSKELVLNGVNMLGGCCGTTPAHIKEL
ncbi:MAG: homocysteine S-methyltransferase family protein, partial [Candidatus Omnitrophica bacterium]|nr:homocysteine S-methyltransferase family protein [Candidatus Omnitrophota bacterium]